MGQIRVYLGQALGEAHSEIGLFGGHLEKGDILAQ